MTMVMNLATGDTMEYSLPPIEAVNAAYEYSRGNKNTWTYGATLSKVKISKSGKTCRRGDWAALMEVAQ